MSRGAKKNKGLQLYDVTPFCLVPVLASLLIKIKAFLCHSPYKKSGMFNPAFENKLAMILCQLLKPALVFSEMR
jgi:hypothetical protein